MEKQVKINISYENILFILKQLDEKEWTWDKENNILVNQFSESLSLQLPIIFPENTQVISWKDYLQSIPEVPLNYLVILMQAGQGAIGFFEEGELFLHKVIRRYMVRKKQGKSQLSQLKTKGKSKLGSRIRLAQTEDFILTIQEKINDWEVNENVEKFFYQASQVLWNKLFEEENMPFEKNDERLIKIPKDLPTPTLEVLLEVQKFLEEGTLFGNWEEVEVFEEEYSC